ncbi:hypothetical protein I7I48_12295 [Histoplasma ohiense]|nr:hypothetical protein I7I48_12295 [Histoplasma ohiense (nom. inval.)]
MPAVSTASRSLMLHIAYSDAWIYVLHVGQLIASGNARAAIIPASHPSINLSHSPLCTVRNQNRTATRKAIKRGGFCQWWRVPGRCAGWSKANSAPNSIHPGSGSKILCQVNRR